MFLLVGSGDGSFTPVTFLEPYTYRGSPVDPVFLPQTRVSRLVLFLSWSPQRSVTALDDLVGPGYRRLHGLPRGPPSLPNVRSIGLFFFREFSLVSGPDSL